MFFHHQHHKTSALLYVSILFLTKSSLLHIKPKDKFNGAVRIVSSCGNNFTTNWNSKNVGSELQAWFKGMAVFDAKKENEENYFRSYLLLDRKTNIIKSMRQVGWSNYVRVGPIWKKAGFNTQHLFQDGFLYANANNAEAMTGCSIKLNILHV